MRLQRSGARPQGCLARSWLFSPATKLQWGPEGPEELGLQIEAWGQPFSESFVLFGRGTMPSDHQRDLKPVHGHQTLVWLPIPP